MKGPGKVVENHFQHSVCTQEGAYRML